MDGFDNTCYTCIVWIMKHQWKPSIQFYLCLMGLKHTVLLMPDGAPGQMAYLSFVYGFIFCLPLSYAEKLLKTIWILVKFLKKLILRKKHTTDNKTNLSNLYPPTTGNSKI